MLSKRLVLAFLYSFGFILAPASGALASAPLITATGLTPAFILAYDGDPSLCHPLLRLYNALLAPLWAAVRRRPNSTVDTTDFAQRNLPAFAAAGFTQPPVLVTSEDGVAYYTADLYNDGRPHTLTIYPRSAGGNNIDSSAVLLRPGLELPLPAAAHPSFPAYFLRSADLVPDPTNPDFFSPYILAHLPRTDPRRNFYADYATVQIFRYRGRTFFLTGNNPPLVTTAATFANSIFVAYTLTPTGSTDQCYLGVTLIPSP